MCSVIMKIKTVISKIVDNSDKIRRVVLKIGGYISLGTVALGFIAGCLWVYCMSH